MGKKTFGIILFTALVSSCGSKRNVALVTETVKSPAATNDSDKGASGDPVAKAKTTAAEEKFTTDSPLLETLSQDYKAASPAEDSNEYFDNMIIGSNEINESGKMNPVQYITLQKHLEGNGPQENTVMTARHTLAGTANGTHVFINRYLPFGYFDAENSFFGVPVNDEKEFENFKKSLLESNELKDGSAIVTITEFKSDSFSENQSRVRFLKINPKHVKMLSFAEAKSRHEKSFDGRGNAKVLVNLFDLGVVYDSFITSPEKVTTDFEDKNSRFETCLEQHPSFKEKENKENKEKKENEESVPGSDWYNFNTNND